MTCSNSFFPPPEDGCPGAPRLSRRAALGTLLATALPGCALQPPAGAGGAYAIDDGLSSPNADSRVRFLVLHYTAEPLDRSLELLTTRRPGAVSAHYLVPDAPGGDGVFRVRRLVPEDRRAWHAGVSAWQDARLLNAASIGIEIVHPGHHADDAALPPALRRWDPFPADQIDVVGRLARDIVDRHAIRADCVVAHADIAPGRKFDPGPMFPWRILARDHGVGLWPDEAEVRRCARERPYDGDVTGLQRSLAAYGYALQPSGVLDAPTAAVLTAFQMHFRPARFDGGADVETVAVLDALLLAQDALRS